MRDARQIAVMARGVDNDDVVIWFASISTVFSSARAPAASSSAVG